jgi:hypothetical protein
MKKGNFKYWVILTFLFNCNQHETVVSNYNDKDSFMVNNPYLPDNYSRGYNPDNLDEMFRISDSLDDNINLIIENFKKDLSTNICVNNAQKSQLILSIDSLHNTFNDFLGCIRNCEEVSYNGGHLSGRHSLDLRIYQEGQFLKYLKFTLNGYKLAYLTCK